MSERVVWGMEAFSGIILDIAGVEYTLGIFL